jgi:hypothetical protein
VSPAERVPATPATPTWPSPPSNTYCIWPPGPRIPLSSAQPSRATNCELCRTWSLWQRFLLTDRLISDQLLDQSWGLMCPIFLRLLSKGKFHNVGPNVGHNADGDILSHCHIVKHRMGSLWQFRPSSQLQIFRRFRTSQMPSTHLFSTGVIGTRLRLNAPGLRSQTF